MVLCRICSSIQKLGTKCGICSAPVELKRVPARCLYCGTNLVEGNMICTLCGIDNEVKQCPGGHG